MSSQLREGRHVHEAARVWGLGFRVDEVVLITPFLPARYLIRWSTAMWEFPKIGDPDIVP